MNNWDNKSQLQLKQGTNVMKNVFCFFLFVLGNCYKIRSMKRLKVGNI